MNRVYWTYRVSYYNKWEGRYYPSFRLDQQYADYKEAWLTNTLDNIIPEERYTTELAPWIKKSTRFIIWEYDPLYVDPNKYKLNVQNVGAEFQIEMFATVEVARQWIRDNTDLIEDTVTAGKFLIQDGSVWNIPGAVIPAQYLIIN